MTVSPKDLRVLFLQSGNRCAFPGCMKELTYKGSETNTPISISEVAHIVAQSLDGPRGSFPLALEERDKYDNLILLCEEHHHIVDDAPASYPVEMLRRWKETHERLMSHATGQAAISSIDQKPVDSYTTEVVYSTLLPVLHMPTYLYSAPCKFAQSDMFRAKQEVISLAGEMAPFIIHDSRLICFNNLNYFNNPFRNLISDGTKISRYETREWWADPDYNRLFVQLLNQSLHKLTGRKGLNWDNVHKRYYFFPKQVGELVEASYQPLNRARTTRRVVWEPQTKITGTGKGYWFHLAVSLQFLHVGKNYWCLCIRPEMHLTQDGIASYPSEKVGRRITRKISRRFNYDLLGDIQFWRSFLSEDQPRILLSFGKSPQYIEISTKLMDTKINWPGTPEEHAKPFKNIELPETLFSWAELDQLARENESEFDEEDEELVYENDADIT